MLLTDAMSYLDSCFQLVQGTSTAATNNDGANALFLVSVFLARRDILLYIAINVNVDLSMIPHDTLQAFNSKDLGP